VDLNIAELGEFAAFVLPGGEKQQGQLRPASPTVANTVRPSFSLPPIFREMLDEPLRAMFSIYLGQLASMFRRN
jgi:hypothetical protein